MTPQKALDETITLFGIQAKDLSEVTGIGENRISRYRHGANMTVETFFALYRALPTRAQIHCWMLIGENDDSSLPLDVSEQRGLYEKIA